MTDNAKREVEIVREWVRRSEVAGDSMALKVQGWTGMGDFTEADHGEAPKGAQWV